MARKIKRRKFKLSEKRQDWVENRDTTLHGKPLRLNGRFQQRQAEEVERMIDKMRKEVDREVMKLYRTPVAKQAFAQDATLAAQVRMLMNRLSREWESRFNLFSKDWAEKMVTGINKNASRDLSQSMEQLSGGLTIKSDSISDQTRDILTASANQAASLIKTIAPDYLSSVSESLMRTITMPESSFAKAQKEVHGLLQDRYKRYRNKAKNIVLDQTKKTYESLNTQRMREIGVTEYIWRHSGGSQNPRSFHKNVLNGQKFSIDEPPIIDQRTGERGEPGQLPYCKCYKEPVISFNK